MNGIEKGIENGSTNEANISSSVKEVIPTVNSEVKLEDPDRHRDIWQVALHLAYRHEWDVEHVYTGLIACEKAGAKWSYFIGRYLIGDKREPNSDVERILPVLLEALYSKKEVFAQSFEH